MTYEENLITTALELSQMEPISKTIGLTESELIKKYKRQAKYCLKKQTEAYRKGWSASCGVSEIENELKKLGLIP